VTLIDISKRKQAEQALIAVNNSLESRVETRSNELKAAQKELLRTEKLAAIGQMSTAIAHELNQPLTGLRTLVYSAELLLSRNQIKETHNTLSQVEAMISRMHKLTSELKVIAYQRPEKLGVTRLEDCIDKALISLGSKADELDLDIQLNEHYVCAEPTRLERIFANLFSNTLDACYEHKIPARIIFNSELIDNKVQIRVEDNGPGVDESTLSHLFEPFYTSKTIGKGLGLGLAISANLAKDMQGTLTAKHGTPSGLTFILTLEQTAP
jgi:C4-dicarboxylate-specific signal transduction histidine kinase